MKLNILFVDDEPSTLLGLKRSLRSQRQEWNMLFAESAKVALKILRQEKVNVIVSDMKMPEMDGASLLEQVAKNHPDVIRIILSGHSDKEYIARTAGVAHQFLNKPANVETIIKIINRTFLLKDYLGHSFLCTYITSLKTLPSLPELYQEIVQKMHSPEVSIHDIAKIIAKDPGMSIKILQLVNSAFFGLGHKISNINNAVVIIGLETVKAMVLSIDIFSQFEQRKIKASNFSIQVLQKHSFEIAELASYLAELENAPKSVIDDCYLAGLVHDVGIMILEQNFSEKYINVFNLIEQGMDSQTAERQVFGTTHSAVGAYLLGIWGLPDIIVEAVAFHHEPSQSNCNEFCPLVAVYAANMLLDMHTSSSNDKAIETSKLDRNFLKQAGVLKSWESWKEKWLE